MSARPRQRFAPPTEPAPVTIFGPRGGKRRVVSADKFRRDRGLVECKVCFTWDTTARIESKQHTCRYTNGYVRDSPRSGVDANFSTRPRAIAADPEDGE